MNYYSSREGKTRLAAGLTIVKLVGLKPSCTTRSIGIFLAVASSLEGDPSHKFLNPTNQHCHSIPTSNMKIANQSVVHALLFFVLVSYPSSIEAGKQGGGPKGVTAVKSLRRILQDEDSVVSQDEDNMSFASNSMDDDRSIQGPTKRECEFCK
jgi:hypothetical protein